MELSLQRLKRGSRIGGLDFVLHNDVGPKGLPVLRCQMYSQLRCQLRVQTMHR